MKELRRSNCKECGRPIVWGVTDSGRVIPLDLNSLCYSRVSSDTDEIRQEPATLCTHFQTCSGADEFSGKGKDVQTALLPLQGAE